VKQRLWLWTGFGLFLVVAVLSAPKVRAETGGYPYPSKPCVHAPYTVQGAGPNWCPNYDWGDRPNDTSPANVISPYGYYYRNCTDYAAWKVSTLGVAPERYKGLGDAKTWAIRAPPKGVRVDSRPAVGSVAVRTSGTFGHTAFVEEVRPDGTIRVSQYNYRADGTYSENVGTPAAFGFVAFVHFEDFGTAPPPVAAPAAPPVEAAAPDVEPPPLAEPAAEAPAVLEDAPEELGEDPEAEVVEATQPASEPEPVQALGAETPQEEPETIAVVARAAIPRAATPEPAVVVAVQPRPEGRGAVQHPQPTSQTPVGAAIPQPSAVLAAKAPPTMPLSGAWDLWAVMGLAGCLILRELMNIRMRYPGKSI